MRHYLNLRILYSEFNEFQTVGPYELNWITEQYKCWISHYISTALLASLQALNLFWLFHILRIAYRIVFFKIAEDDRSDNDDDELAEELRQEALANREFDRVDELHEGAAAKTNGAAKSSSAEVRVNGATNRKGN